MTLNTNVVQFAQSKMGQRVGTGECFDLADQALRSTGARSAADYGRITRTADYIWGQVVSLALTRPGDIIQFRSYTETIITTIDYADGSGETLTQTNSRPHHTAIVCTIQSNGRRGVYEQNVANVRRVVINDLHFQTHTVPARTEQRNGQLATITQQITVSGTVRFYRPQPRTDLNQ